MPMELQTKIAVILMDAHIAAGTGNGSYRKIASKAIYDNLGVAINLPNHDSKKILDRVMAMRKPASTSQATQATQHNSQAVTQPQPSQSSQTNKPKKRRSQRKKNSKGNKTSSNPKSTETVTTQGHDLSRAAKELLITTMDMMVTPSLDLEAPIRASQLLPKEKTVPIPEGTVYVDALDSTQQPNTLEVLAELEEAAANPTATPSSQRVRQSINLCTPSQFDVGSQTTTGTEPTLPTILTVRSPTPSPVLDNGKRKRGSPETQTPHKRPFLAIQTTPPHNPPAVFIPTTPGDGSDETRDDISPIPYEVTPEK